MPTKIEALVEACQRPARGRPPSQPRQQLRHAAGLPLAGSAGGPDATFVESGRGSPQAASAGRL
jgi:hypothetical protein